MLKRRFGFCAVRILGLGSLCGASVASMKIVAVRVFVVDFPYDNLGHSRLRTRSIALDDTIVAVETDTGLVGWGEACVLSPTYLESSKGMLRAAIEEVAPMLIGLDPREIGVVNATMDAAIRGHAAGKSAIDMACWDLLGKSTGLPVSTLVGGAQMPSAPFYRSIPTDEPDVMVESVRAARSDGIGVFQVKLGEGADADIERMRAIAEVVVPGERMICDANRGWTMADARRAVAAADRLDPTLELFIEQPCPTYEESLQIRRMCARPFVLDEVIDDMADLLRAIGDNALDALVVKVSHSGGLTKAGEMINTAIRAGILVRVEDTVGADLVRSAVASRAVAVAPRMMLATYPFPAPVVLGAGGAAIKAGRLTPSPEPGLGVDVDMPTLGGPVAEFS